MKILNNKKILAIGLILIAAVSTMAVISATETITVDGLKFTIPDGYTPHEKETDASQPYDAEDVEGTPVDKETSSEFINSAGDKLKVQVGSKNNQKIDSLTPVGEKKKIAGKDGYFYTENDDGKTEYKFEYLQDGKVVKVTAASEDIISKVIS